MWSANYSDASLVNPVKLNSELDGLRGSLKKLVAVRNSRPLPPRVRAVISCVLVAA